MAQVNLAGETMTVLAGYGLLWERESTLFVADVHLGKAASFRNMGRIPLPSGTTASTLDRLTILLQSTQAQRLIVLGDLWHSKAGRDEPTLRAAVEWRETHAEVEMILVEGNHDRRAGRLPAEMRMAEWLDPTPLGPFALQHEPLPASGSVAGKYALAGHIHPGVRMNGAGQSLKLPCFWFGPEVGILPSFGDFTGCALVEPALGDVVFVVAENRVISVGRGERIVSRL